MLDKKIKYAWIDPEKNKLEVGYSYTEESGKEVHVEGEKHDDFLHKDLIAAFANLRVHLAVMCGFAHPDTVKEIKTPPAEIVEMFRVNQFSMGKDLDDPGVTLTGGINIPWMNNKYMSANSPYTRYEETEETAYRFVKDLKKRVDRCAKEVQLYLSAEKRGEDPQQSLGFPDSNGQEKPADIEQKEKAA
jgi:hypothetical protein